VTSQTSGARCSRLEPDDLALGGFVAAVAALAAEPATVGTIASRDLLWLGLQRIRLIRPSELSELPTRCRGTAGTDEACDHCCGWRRQPWRGEAEDGAKALEAMVVVEHVQTWALCRNDDGQIELSATLIPGAGFEPATFGL
jgi:hypothetical protein